MRLEFDPDLGYGSEPVVGKDMTLDQYLALPVIGWCHSKIGCMDWPRDPQQVLTGQGWEVYADWGQYYKEGTVPRTFILTAQDLSTELITEFWMRFQR